MLATDVRHLGLGTITALSATAAMVAGVALVAVSCQQGRGAASPPLAPAAVAASRLPLAGCDATPTVALRACEDPRVTAVVFKGRVHALEAQELATFHLRFADLPDGYSVMTGPRGEFEIRIARDEMAAVDLCALQTSGRRTTAFSDEQLTIEYELRFER